MFLSTHYDAIVIGARAAGASTAMLIARRGGRVLMVDRARRGSDTLSTHALMRGAVTRLADWGLLDAVYGAGTPAISAVAFTYGPDGFTIPIKPTPEVPGLAAPRRTVLDPILVEAAEASGVVTSFETSLAEVLMDPSGRVRGVVLARGGETVTVSADLVIGADGRTSSLARAVDAPVTRAGIAAGAYCARYYEDADLASDRFHWLYADKVGAGVIPTNDGHVVFTARPPEVFRAGRDDVARLHREALEAISPDLAVAVRGANPTSPLRSFPGIPGRFRKPFGPGWALVGDAGYFKDPFAAHGITDAFRDAELLTRAWETGDYAGYEAERDARSFPLFDVLERIASFSWTLDELRELHVDLSRAMRADDEYQPALTLAA